MPLAIFGITSNVLNLVVTFALLGLVAIWIALIVFTFNDARRRISDPFLVACATAASFFPFLAAWHPCQRRYSLLGGTTSQISCCPPFTQYGRAHSKQIPPYRL